MIVFIILDEGSQDHGVITQLNDAPEAAAHAEELIARGVAPETIRIYNAKELGLRLSYRTIVDLEAEDPAADGASAAADAAPAEGPSTVEEEAERVAAAASAGDEAYHKDGEKLSSALKRPEEPPEPESQLR